MKPNIDFLFLTGLYPKEKEKEIFENTKGNLQVAADSLQWGFVKGLNQNLKNPVKIINSLFVGSYPRRYKKLIIPSFRFGEECDGMGINVGFLNLTFIKEFSRYFTLKFALRKWAKEQGSNKVLLAYAMLPTFTRLLRYAKKLNANIATCLIVPDLPQYMNTSGKTSLSYTLWEKLSNAVIKSDMKYIDSYVLLTENMKEALGIKKPYVVIEGIVPDNLVDDNCCDKSDFSSDSVKTILYTGTLAEKYGVLDLINAFRALKRDDVKLIICGYGDAHEKIKEEALNDSRIIYKGLVNKQEVQLLQRDATLLINPRRNEGEYTKYSFPSKILEYMASGTPVVAYMLDGMPEEYKDYIYLISEEKGLANTLNDLLNCSTEILRMKGLMARDFVMKNKNGKVQCGKIIKIIAELEEDL